MSGTYRAFSWATDLVSAYRSPYKHIPEAASPKDHPPQGQREEIYTVVSDSAAIKGIRGGDTPSPYTKSSMMCEVKAFRYACECFAYVAGTYKECTTSPCLKTVCHETDVAEACREFAGL